MTSSSSSSLSSSQTESSGSGTSPSIVRALVDCAVGRICKLRDMLRVLEGVPLLYIPVVVELARSDAVGGPLRDVIDGRDDRDDRGEREGNRDSIAQELRRAMERPLGATRRRQVRGLSISLRLLLFYLAMIDSGRTGRRASTRQQQHIRNGLAMHCRSEKKKAKRTRPCGASQ